MKTLYYVILKVVHTYHVIGRGVAIADWEAILKKAIFRLQRRFNQNFNLYAVLISLRRTRPGVRNSCVSSPE